MIITIRNTYSVALWEVRDITGIMFFKSSQAASKKYENVELDVLRYRIRNIGVHNYDEVEIYQMKTSTLDY